MNFKKLILFCFTFLLLCNESEAQQKKKRVKREVRRYPLTFLNVGYGHQKSQLFLNKNYLFYGIWDEKVYFEGRRGANFTAQYGKSFNRNFDLCVGLAHDRMKILQTKGFDFVPADPKHFGANKIDSAYRTIRMHRVEIPIDLRYKFYMKKRLAFSTGLGIGFSFYNTRNQAVDMIFDTGKRGDNPINDDLMQQTRGVNLAGILRVGLVFEPDKDLAIKIEPFYKHYWKKEPILDNYKNVNPFGIGVMLGIEHTLNMAAKKEKKKRLK